MKDKSIKNKNLQAYKNSQTFIEKKKPWQIGSVLADYSEKN